MLTALLVGAAAALGEPGPVAPAPRAAPASQASPETPAPPAPAPPQAHEPQARPAPEAAAFCQKLAERYRALSAYRDESALVEVVTRQGAEAHRVESRILCRLEGDRLSVETAGDQVRQGLAQGAAPPLSPGMESLVRRYNLWLAPHMALHFAADPLRELRPGVPQGFLAASSGAEPASGGRSVVRLELRSAESPGEASADAAATFYFWVDAESMLVRRVSGRQKLPDGALYEMTLDIEPKHAAP